jgi:hypothetical protein
MKFLSLSMMMIALVLAACSGVQARTNRNLPTIRPAPPPTPTQTGTPIPSQTELSAEAIGVLLRIGRPKRGEELFNTFQPDAGFACATCHNDDSEGRLIGPGLLNILKRAETRVERMTAAEYIYTSIVNPDAYIVEGFPDDLMPENWATIYSLTDISDIMGYLATLQNEE